MSLAVVTVASGGLPVVELAAGKLGLPVTEAANGRGIAVTKVVGAPGLPVVFDTIGVGPGPVTNATLDPATVTAVTLSGGNLVATNTGTTSADQGVRVATVAGKTTGKYYFEMTGNSVTSAGVNHGVGIGTPTSTYINMGNGGTTGVVGYRTGSVYSNGSSVLTFAGYSNGEIAGVAVDLDNRKIWFRKSPSGIWNGNASFNPATNVGGATIPAGTMVPFCLFGGAGGSAGSFVTINFGASAFSGAVPAGFTAGWPA